MKISSHTWIPIIAFLAAAPLVLAASCAGEPDAELPPPVEVPVDSVPVDVPPPPEPDTAEDVALECPVCEDCPEATEAVFEFTESELEGCFESHNLGFLLCPVL